MLEPHRLRRHDLVSLSPAGWDAACAQLGGAAAALAARWRERGWPAVVRRSDPGTPPDMVGLGMPAPPEPGTGRKVRIGVTVARWSIASVRPPLTLAEALQDTALPPAWQDGCGALRDAMAGARIDCRVFGSLAMQAITGEPYLGPASDIDVLLRPANLAQLDTGLDLLARHAAGLPLDGEIEFPSGHAVSWKEWLDVARTPAAGGAKVLTKHLDSVALLTCDALRRQFDGAAHA